MANDVLRAEHDEVLKNLSTRESTRQFAHGGVSAIFAMLTGFSALGLWVATGTEHEYWPPVAGLFSVAVLYSLFRLANGYRLNRIERAHLRRLLELRKSLGFDLP
jgi:hypothetical protein